MAPNHKKVLLVDDDPLILRIYRDGLARCGLEVETAEDGLAAMKVLRSGKPDVVVLDLMMPKFSGVEVLKFIRGQPELTGLPVVVLSNSYMGDMASGLSVPGAQKALLKVRCSPAILFEAIQEVLAGRASVPGIASPGEAVRGAVVPPQHATSPGSTATSAAGPKPPVLVPQPPPAGRSGGETELRTKARGGFLQNADSTCAALRALFQAFSTAPNERERGLRLQDFYRKVHFLSASAGLSEHHRIGQIATVLEALLFQLMDQPSRLSPSVSRTIATTVDFLEELFRRAGESDSDAALAAQVLVVDADPVSNRLVIWAMRQAGLRARSAEDPRAALQVLCEQHFDLVLLEVELPMMDGFEVCRRLRALPGYQQVPVIYVTLHSDFESRAEGRLSGAQDLISKPILPMELAVKAVTHLLKSQLPAAPQP